MLDIKFGTKQLANPTPAGVSRTIDIVVAVCGVCVTWLTQADFIPNRISNVIAGVLGLLIGLAVAIKPFYGVMPTETKIPVEDVTTMEEEPKS